MQIDEENQLNWYLRQERKEIKEEGNELYKKKKEKKYENRANGDLIGIILDDELSKKKIIKYIIVLYFEIFWIIFQNE